MDDNVFVCRCQEVTLGEVVTAIRAGAHTTDEVKKRTRAGMGLCQGRTCNSIIERALQAELGLVPSDVTPQRARIPVRPVELHLLGEDHESTEQD